MLEQPFFPFIKIKKMEKAAAAAVQTVLNIVKAERIKKACEFSQAFRFSNYLTTTTLAA